MRPTAILICALLSSATWAKAAPVALEPAGPWKVDYAERSCILSRTYSAAGHTYPFEVVLEPVTPEAWLRFGSDDEVRERDDGDAMVEVDGAPLKSPVHYNIFGAGSGGAVREFWFKDYRQELGTAERSLRIRPGKHGDFDINLAGFGKAKAAVYNCLDDLHRSLGIDPSILTNIARAPEGSAFSFVRFPQQTGGLDLVILYWVNVEGRVDDCRLLAPTGDLEFDGSVCATLKAKGSFVPGRDRFGASIRAPMYENIRLRTETRVSTTPL